MTREISLWEERNDAQRAREYEEALAYNARLFELARHNGYRTETYHTGFNLCWPVPDQLIGVTGFMVAVLS